MNRMTRMNRTKRMTPLSRKRQEGASLLVVLVLLTVLLLGGLSMARVTASTGQIAGNTAFRDAALQASEVGLSDAFVKVKALTDEENDQDGYYASRQPQDAAGLPTGFDWADVTATTVGNYSVRSVIERLCTGTMPVTDIARQCVIKQLAQESSAKAGTEAMDSPAAKQFRVTVNVTGPKNTQVFVQNIVVR